MDPTQLREERMRIYTEMRGIIDGAREAKRSITTSENERYETLLRELDEKEALLRDADRERDLAVRMAQITAVEAEHTDRALGGVKDPEKEYQRIFRKYLRSGMSMMTPQESQALLVGGAADDETQRAVNQALQELRDQGIATGAAGGFIVPQGFWARIQETQKFFGGMLVSGTVLDTDSGNPIPWPTNDDTANEGEILGENVATTVLDLVFGTRSLGAYMFSSRMIRASIQLLQDTGVDVEAYIARKAGQRIGRRLNRAFTTGTGTGEPQGIVTGIPAGQILTLPTGNVNTFGTAAPTAGVYRNLIDLIHRVDAAYRNSAPVANGGDGDVDACKFMLHDLTLAAIRKLEDAQARPLWAPSLQEGVPGTIFGYPYEVNNHMAVAGASNKTIIFGNFGDAYVRRNVKGGSLLRLTERYAEALQVAFLAFERHDGIVDDGLAVAVLQNSAT